MRSLLALVLFVTVVTAQEDDPLPVAPPPRLKALPTAKKKAEPAAVATAKMKAEPTTAAKADPVPTPAPKTTPTPEPAPKTVAKAELPPAPPTSAPKAEQPTNAKADEKPVASEAYAAPKPALPFMDWTLPLCAVYTYGALALLVVLRTYTVKPKP